MDFKEVIFDEVSNSRIGKTPHVETHLHNLDQRIKQNKLWTILTSLTLPGVVILQIGGWT
jgi:hypothetical protein